LANLTYVSLLLLYDILSHRQMRGGAISNDGGAMTFTAGSFFDSNSASGSGDGGMGGAIFNGAGGVIT